MKKLFKLKFYNDLFHFIKTWDVETLANNSDKTVPNLEHIRDEVLSKKKVIYGIEDWYRDSREHNTWEKAFVDRQIDVDPEINKLVDENFWELSEDNGTLPEKKFSQVVNRPSINLKAVEDSELLRLSDRMSEISVKTNGGRISGLIFTGDELDMQMPPEELKRILESVTPQYDEKSLSPPIIYGTAGETHHGVNDLETLWKSWREDDTDEKVVPNYITLESVGLTDYNKSVPAQDITDVDGNLWVDERGNKSYVPGTDQIVSFDSINSDTSSDVKYDSCND